jgi:hypothetical protein
MDSRRVYHRVLKFCIGLWVTKKKKKFINHNLRRIRSLVHLLLLWWPSENVSQNRRKPNFCRRPINHKESLELFGCFRGLKHHLFSIFRGLKYGRTFLEFPAALNGQNKAVSGDSKGIFEVFRILKVPHFVCLRWNENWRKLKLNITLEGCI